MKETGIIMSGNHPKLILDGIKTQTRRVIKHPAIPNSDIVGVKEYLYMPAQEHPSEMDVPEGYYALLKCNANQDRNTSYFRSPYGQVGDRLWVKETWAHDPEGEGGTRTILYKADMDWESEAYFKQDGGKWRSSLFIPRWASRITLEITEVRVERLQEITFDDCVKEGISLSGKLHISTGDTATDYALYFKELWDSLNAKRGFGWDTNC